ncbi:hypothetical protein H9Q09_11830 [Aurantimonas sp. DM33-3]|uniref:hypothetical protein n=1 Tax=Aurantimonas sp. DM33-3 TaxID=2766955 RepID=UPI001651C594|nr:hypothetical protein [Aurantimonas sp. DM33-3]MBC6716897.1 hypothetical protein [Aurantimonas sp. DM33-3]
MTSHPVTDHAVVRYFERVHSIDFDALFPDATHDGQRLAAICRYLDIQPSDARDLVCPPRLHRWIADGACAITVTGYRLVCDERRVVTTLINDRKRRRPRWRDQEIAA